MINTHVIQQLINQIKAADFSNQKEIKLDIATAKNLSYTLSLILTRLVGNYETLLKDKSQAEVVSVEMDGGNWSKK